MKRCFLCLSAVFLWWLSVDASAGGKEAKASAIDSHVKTLAHALAYSYDKPVLETKNTQTDNWNSWITVLEHKEGSKFFECVFNTAVKPAGKIYALCGLYFCSQSTFKQKISELEQNPIPGDMSVIKGDAMLTVPVMSVIQSDGRYSPPVRLWYGETLSDYIVRKGSIGDLDVSGGGIPLRLLDESWVQRTAYVDFSDEIAPPSFEEGMAFVVARERLYRRWKFALEMHLRTKQ